MLQKVSELWTQFCCDEKYKPVLTRKFLNFYTVLGDNVIKHFTTIVYKCSKQARVFVLCPWQTFQAQQPMFGGQAGSLPQRGNLLRCHTLVGSIIAQTLVLGCKGLPGTNTLAYQHHEQIMTVKCFITLLLEIIILIISD